MNRRAMWLAAALVLTASVPSPKAQQRAATGRVNGDSAIVSGFGILAPTNHAPLPGELSQLWLAPERGRTAARPASSPIATAARLIAAGEAAKALPIVSQPALQRGLLGPYALYYSGLARLRLNRAPEALRAFITLRDRKPQGYLAEAAALGEAAAHEQMKDYGEAVSVYERLLKTNPTNLEDVVLRLGRAAKEQGNQRKAAYAFARVYYEFALNERAAEAGSELALMHLQPATSGSPRFKLELGRAERLFGARQVAAARDMFNGLRPIASGADRDLIVLRLAECEYLLRGFRSAREGIRPFVERGPRQAEAMYYFAAASRDLGDQSTFLSLSRRVIEEFPNEIWAEEALNALGTYYIREDQDDRADEVFRELYQKYPTGRYAERAAWKAGWRAYRVGKYADTVRLFEAAAADFPRADYRPSWIYWAGRAHDQLGEKALATERYALVAADYLNSYYGRLAIDRTKGRAPLLRPVPATKAAAGDVALTSPPPPTAPTIRALLGADMYDDALHELQFARKAWGDSSAIQATMAWANQQQATTETGTRRFQLMRGAITTMRRAYPQFMAAGGEELPRDVLTVIFPLAYWDLIKRYSAASSLDPYLVAALVAQESTFVADIQSSANARGLMQLLPSTARQYARKLKLRYSAKLLTTPESNIRIGTAHLADMVREFGGDMHLVLASYNAGSRPVRQWMAERPGLDRDEFIDDIPYPETQNYVKRILGTADDYRRLYGPAAAPKS